MMIGSLTLIDLCLQKYFYYHSANESSPSGSGDLIFIARCIHSLNGSCNGNCKRHLKSHKRTKQEPHGQHHSPEKPLQINKHTCSKL